jgi:hypothetical protein
MSTAGNDDKSPLIDLISCIVCNQTMKLEKSSPDAEGRDIIQYRCRLCNRIEQVRLLRRSRDSTDWRRENDGSSLRAGISALDDGSGRHIAGAGICRACIDPKQEQQTQRSRAASYDGERQMNELDDQKAARSQWSWFALALAAMTVIAYVATGLAK